MAQANAVGIIGTGWVGSSVAISALHLGLAHELLLHDARTAIAEGEAMDLAHGGSFYPAAHVRAAPLDDLLDTRAVVIAAGRASTGSQSRLELLRDNARLIANFARAFCAYRGVVVLVTNPVDVLTHVFQQVSGLPAARVVGTGTMLDTSRLRHVIGRELALDPRSVHAQVVGEHGDSEVVLWSSAHIGGTPLRQWPGWSASREDAIAREVRTAAYEIIQRKGATNHAIGVVAANLLRSILHDERRVLTVSRTQEGELGLTSLAMSLPAVVGARGAEQVIAPVTDAVELESIARSAQVLRDAIAAAQGGEARPPS
jgi:L-lactate dehydrogenase